MASPNLHEDNKGKVTKESSGDVIRLNVTHYETIKNDEYGWTNLTIVDMTGNEVLEAIRNGSFVYFFTDFGTGAFMLPCMLLSTQTDAKIVFTAYYLRGSTHCFARFTFDSMDSNTGVFEWKY